MSANTLCVMGSIPIRIKASDSSAGRATEMRRFESCSRLHLG